MRRVELGPQALTIHIDLAPLLDAGEATVRHTLATRLCRRGVETRLILEERGSESGAGRVDPALVKAIVRGRRWFEDLASGRAQSLLEIAEAEGVSDRYVAHLIPLAFLAGEHPVDLTTEILTKRTRLPFDWAEQRKELGFSRRLRNAKGLAGLG